MGERRRQPRGREWRGTCGLPSVPPSVLAMAERAWEEDEKRGGAFALSDYLLDDLDEFLGSEFEPAREPPPLAVALVRPARRPRASRRRATARAGPGDDDPSLREPGHVLDEGKDEVVLIDPDDGQDERAAVEQLASALADLLLADLDKHPTTGAKVAP